MMRESLSSVKYLTPQLPRLTQPSLKVCQLISVTWQSSAIMFDHRYHRVSFVHINHFSGGMCNIDMIQIAVATVCGVSP